VYWTNILNKEINEKICLCYINLQKYQEAEHFAENNLRLNQADFEAAFLIGVINFTNKNFEKARAYFHHVIKVKPDHQKAQEYLETLMGESCAIQ
jgi:tetratricopeptide (TPR) repeat protein